MSSVTPRERHAVAKSLRYLADLPGGPLENDEQFTAVLKYWVFSDFKRYSYDETLTRLADLIDPTCHMSWEYGNGDDDTEEYMEEIAGTHEDTVACHCHSCDEVFRYDRNVIPNYCPHCGARVVRDEA